MKMKNNLKMKKSLTIPQTNMYKRIILMIISLATRMKVYKQGEDMQGKMNKSFLSVG